MDYNEEKIDEYTLALMFLVAYDRKDGVWDKSLILTIVLS